ncbi:Lymphokine-activated killer T-cell-originated protein kinase [Frankliniella fusca]|uniref:Lymphokine-activated killer T-cell-originated protein kinase n=1 Tax=Frankliniella fusca TaxID=407009 RepID=A0AAE1HXN1_9NEOP|nr:Lymphokine-activated killer T-cell-originated protein kinase [Frankliniella fusca]
MAEFLTPKADKTRVSKIPKTPINIPPSPFMKKLGFGTGVSVFRWDRSPRPDATRSPWAVKKLNKRDLPQFIEQRLQKEAELLKSLKHPNIVGFRACVPGKDGRMTLAMESCESSLADRIEDRRNDGMGPFESEVILKVALGVARGLDYLHREKKILHGDMKSYNILIKGNFDEIKICDFGVSMPLLPDGSVSDPDNFVGTSVWSPPEAVGLSDGPVSSQVDIFAFGLVLWEMIALQIPHTDDLDESDFEVSITEDELENRIGMMQIFLSSKSTRPALPPVDLNDSYNSIMEIFYCCTEQDPSVRPTAQLLVEWLEDLTGEKPMGKGGDEILVDH